MKRIPLVLVTILAVAVICISGCGSGKKKVDTVKVAGTIKMDGTALEGAEVNFMAGEYAGIATTDASGRFELEAQPGENTVYIRKYEGVSGTFDATMLSESDTGGETGGPKQLVPAKYSDPSKTELKFTVPDGGAENADFDLASK